MKSECTQPWFYFLHSLRLGFVTITVIYEAFLFKALTKICLGNPQQGIPSLWTVI